MMQTGTVRVLEAEPETPDQDLEAPGRPSQYENADPIALQDWNYPIPGFTANVLQDVWSQDDVELSKARLVAALEDGNQDVDEAYLLVWPDETLVFLGKDPTAKDAVPWFLYTIAPSEPIPAPDSVNGALDLLKPPEVQDLYYEEEYLPGRHGEWWLIPTQMVPASDVFKPGVGSKPYGASPLGNHVPREYAFTRPGSEFMSEFRGNASAPESVQSPEEALDWTFRQLRKSPVPDGVPDWADVRAWAGEIIVRGTIRHRDDDHYVENLGDVWHKAKTHNIEVWTADSLGNVHLDYYGQ